MSCDRLRVFHVIGPLGEKVVGMTRSHGGNVQLRLGHTAAMFHVIGPLGEKVVGMTRSHGGNVSRYWSAWREGRRYD